MKNKKIVKNLNLEEDENIEMVVRRYLLIYWWKIIIVFLLLLLPFFLFFPLFQWRTWGPIIFVILLMSGLLGLLKIYSSWYFNCLVITNKRVVDFYQKKIFDRIVSENTLRKIEDVNFRQKGIFQSLFHYGAIQYYISPGKAKVVIKGVKNPQKITQKIMELTEEAISAEEKEVSSVDSLDKLRSLLEDIREQLGSEAFHKVVEDIGSEKEDEESGEKNKPKQND